jgi:hypothetical protein
LRFDLSVAKAELQRQSFEFVPASAFFGTVAPWLRFWHTPQKVKTLAIEDIYDDPHKLDSYLESGEPVEILRGGKTVAELAPRKLLAETSGPLKRSPVELRARFLKMWGPDAFRSPISVREEIEEIRRDRAL